jgi:hypothetical protein
LVATATLTTDTLPTFHELLSAIRVHDWQKVLTFQSWEGNRANAEVYALRCADNALSVAVISAPFALEEPYTLMHQEAVDDVAAFRVLPATDTWHSLGA